MKAGRVGRMLRIVRERKGLTQIQLAEKAQVTQAYIAKLETGAKVNPSFEVLHRLAKSLRVPLTQLLE